jgi:methylated-DNA-[protein]-cysteine S-methyltransferase
MQYRHLDSPIGPLLIAGDDDGLRFLLFAHERRGKRDVKPAPEWEPDRGRLKDAVKQLTAYFAGKLHDFDVPVAPEGTSFQRSVWGQLQRIP